ncbi:hypothetical protein SNE40_023124 [Patella caerulea]|uniref:non-specific serine/threonine protein kinase n=1 Tax=Patella caerulea TaxID=87958 RepID=A0AAN8J435_PATCE
MLKVYSQYSKIIQFKNLPNPENVWILQDIVGEGTYGEVYTAKNPETGQIAAVKILESLHEVIEELEEEYLVFRDLSHHPNIPDFYGLYLKTVDLGEDQLWFVMELCGGGAVTDISKDLKKLGKKLDEKTIAHILKETLSVLKYLHDNKVMHRDVKGNNILLTDKGKVKLLDFGVSGHLDDKLGRRKTHVGTPYWMAPEVIACENQIEYSYDVRCDIWSLGITAIELADSSPPLSDVDPRRALFKIPRNPPPTVAKPSDWSDEFLDFIKRCLVKDFEQRPFTDDLLQHPFIRQITDQDIPNIEEKLVAMTTKMEKTVTAPDVTTKHGQFKSGRKSRKDISTSEDLAKMENLDEELIVSQLLNRYIQDMIYTYIGDILLALNPFTPMSIYTEEYTKKYINASKDENPPHIFAVSDQCYQLMMHNKNNQCIVISGESGAGKTESANLLVQHLTQLGKAPNRTLEERILQVNPLMEAFGNAKTVINDNSSRFGKYLEMFFTSSGTVVGAKITEYLLEKSRVINQAKGEQNFHIFYYIHDGLISCEGSENYHLKSSTNYRYIKEYSSKDPDIASLSSNKVKFKAIQHCFNIIGFQEEEVRAVYSILSSILHTGNISFNHQESPGEDQCIITDKALVNTVSKLLGLESKDLIEALTTTGMVAKGEVIIRNNSVQEAVNARDAMAKALYGRLFSWIVNRISSLLKPQSGNTQDNDSLVVGLLDIFGFENFVKNSFEQVCINIANEQIQYYFNQHIFAWEMQEYENEGINASEITFVDNRPILDMFLMKPIGLLALLDEESHFPKATDRTLVDKFHQNIRSPAYSRPKADNLTFCIDHYAGRVEYDAKGFLEKNRDRLSPEVLNILRTSENSVVKALFLTPLTKTGNLQYDSLASSKASSRSSTCNLASPVGNGGGGGFTIQSFSSRSTTSLGGSRIYSALQASGSASMTRIQQTVATYFRYSLMDLLAKMVTGTPHFVRCIKPNDEKDPGHFDSVKVMTQLKYTGVLETTRIRRQGYSHRVSFTDFIKRYHMLGFSWKERPTFTKESCQILLERLGLQNWALGRTKVFLKYYHTEQLARLFENQNKKIVMVQACIRMFIARSRFYKLRWKREKAALEIQTRFRGFQARKIFCAESNKRKMAAISVQKTIRGYLARKEIKPQIEKRRQASTAIQSVFRGHMVRRKAKQQISKEDESAKIIQRAFRIHKARTTARLLRNEKRGYEERAAKMIQTYFRMWRCKTVYQQLLDHKIQRESQLINFGQQVEQLSKDTLNLQKQNNTKLKMIGTPTTPSPTHKNIFDIVTKEHVGQARLEQMKRMSEEKHVIPEKELEYYNKVSGYYHEDKTLTDQQNITSSPDSIDSPDQSYTVQPSTSSDLTDGYTLPASEDQPVRQYNQDCKEIMKEENRIYYDSIVNENTERNLLSLCKKLVKSNVTKLMSDDHESYYQQVIEMANRARALKSASESKDDNSDDKPRPESLLTPLPLSKSESYSNLPWDAPLQNARQSALSVSKPIDSMSDQTFNSEASSHLNLPGTSNDSTVSSTSLSRGSVNIVEDDYQTDKMGFYEEGDKHELARRLEQDVAGSIVALWQTHLPPSGYIPPEAEYDDDDDDEAFEDDDALKSPPPPPPPLPSTVLSPRGYNLAHGLLPPPPDINSISNIEIIERKGNNKVKEEKNKMKVDINKKQPVSNGHTNTSHMKSTSTSPPSNGVVPVNGLNEVGDQVLVNLRSKLRKTKFDYNDDEGTLRKPIEQNVQQVDFRSVLKPGRFSGHWD